MTDEPHPDPCQDVATEQTRPQQGWTQARAVLVQHAGERVSDFVHVHRTDEGMRAFRMHAQAQVPLSDFFARHSSALGLGAHDAVEQYAQGDALPGVAYAKFLQRHRGFIVEGAEVLLTHREVVLSGASSVASGLEEAVEPHLTQAEAVERAVAWVTKQLRVSAVELGPAPVCHLLVTSSASARRRGAWCIAAACS
jgi:hypothetical protein